MTTCVRKAWLTLGALTVQLEDPSQGYFCTELNLGYPDVREVVSNRPDQGGIDDRTQYFGGRVISANITALVGAGAQIDAIPGLFAPFMVPSARPQLHYVLDRPGAGERVMTVRASGFAWPVAGPFQRDIQLQWKASDPEAKDPVTKTATAWAGSSTNPGRLYNLTFYRVYPVGGSAPTTGLISPSGELPVRPLVKVFGPITGPRVQFGPGGSGQPPTSNLIFLPPFIVSAGHFVQIDTYSKTVLMDGDPNQSVVALFDWQNSTWPVCYPVPPAAAGVQLNLYGSSTSIITQVQASWQDRYLT